MIGKMVVYMLLLVQTPMYASHFVDYKVLL